MSRARTESIHFDSRIFDSPMWIKNHKRILICEVNQNHFFLFVIHFGESFYFWFWFIFEASESHWFISINNSFGFLFILIRLDFDSSRIMIHLRIKVKSNLKSKVAGSWFIHLRMIGWFDFESKANHESSWSEPCLSG